MIKPTQYQTPDQLREIFVHKLAKTVSADPGDHNYLARRLNAGTASPATDRPAPDRNSKDGAKQSRTSGGSQSAADRNLNKSGKPNRAQERRSRSQKEINPPRTAVSRSNTPRQAQRHEANATAAEVARMLYATGRASWYLSEIRLFVDVLRTRGMREPARLLKRPDLGPLLSDPGPATVEAFLARATFQELEELIWLLKQYASGEANRPEPDAVTPTPLSQSIRVYELAMELGVSSTFIMARLRETGKFISSASAFIDERVAQELRERVAASTQKAAQTTTTPNARHASKASLQDSNTSYWVSRILRVTLGQSPLRAYCIVFLTTVVLAGLVILMAKYHITP